MKPNQRPYRTFAHTLVVATITLIAVTSFFLYLSARAALVPPDEPVVAPPQPPATAIAKVHKDCARRGLGIRITLPYRKLSQYQITCEDAA